MNDQYELETVADLAFEREPAPVRGSLYRCTVCGKRPIKVKGVLSELKGKERTSFLRKYNAMHKRHKPNCVPESAAEASACEETVSKDGGTAEKAGCRVDGPIGSGPSSDGGGTVDRADSAASEETN